MLVPKTDTASWLNNVYYLWTKSIPLFSQSLRVPKRNLNI